MTSRWLFPREEIEKPVKPGGTSPRTATKYRMEMARFIRKLGDPEFLDMYPSIRSTPLLLLHIYFLCFLCEHQVGITWLACSFSFSSACFHTRCPNPAFSGSILSHFNDAISSTCSVLLQQSAVDNRHSHSVHAPFLSTPRFFGARSRGMWLHSSAFVSFAHLTLFRSSRLPASYSLGK